LRRDVFWTHTRATESGDTPSARSILARISHPGISNILTPPSPSSILPMYWKLGSVGGISKSPVPMGGRDHRQRAPSCHRHPHHHHSAKSNHVAMLSLCVDHRINFHHAPCAPLSESAFFRGSVVGRWHCLRYGMSRTAPFYPLTKGVQPTTASPIPSVITNS
jgi:hypothetical protein